MFGRIQIREVEIFVTRKCCNLWTVCGKRHGCCNESDVLLHIRNFTVCRRLSEYCNVIHSWYLSTEYKLAVNNLELVLGWSVGNFSKACLIRGGTDKSLARPGRKQATATKLGIYSTYSPRSSIYFLALCSNFCKPLKIKIHKVGRPTRSPRQHWPPCRMKNGDLSLVF